MITHSVIRIVRTSDFQLQTEIQTIENGGFQNIPSEKIPFQNISKKTISIVKSLT